jgi:hypothetical protein
MRPCTRRIASAEDVIKATSLDDVLVEHAPWCRTAPNTLPTHTKPLGLRSRSGTRLREPFLLEARLATRIELDHLGRTRRLEVGRRNPNDVQVHSSLLSLCEGRLAAPSGQREPEAKSEMSCGVAVSKPTTSSIPGSFGSAIEKPFETIPTTTSRASMPDAWR